MAVDSIRDVVQVAIQRASNATGVDFSFLLGTAKRESGYNPGAHAQTSSAAGLFQFTEQTWLTTLRQYGARYGYARYADLIQKSPDGHCFVQGGEARKAVMDLRFDPHAASLMAGELTSEHASYLRGRVGRDPTAGELYAAHFLGPQGSAKLIESVRSAPQTPAASLFPDAAAANRSIFYRDGRAATVSEVYANLTRAPNLSGGVVAQAAAAPPPQADFVQYASARRIDRIAQEQALVDMVLRGPEQPEQSSSLGGVAGSMFSGEMLRALTQANGGRGG